MKAIFVASSGQDVGKTTTSLGIFSWLKERYGRVGFFKPVGQQHITLENGCQVDKDVQTFRQTFALTDQPKHMSPVLIPQGFTKKYIEGKVNTGELEKNIRQSFEEIRENNDFVVVEGTGHVGVGSIIGLSNARVAKLLGLDVILIVKGGLGNAIDQINLNSALLNTHGVKLSGIILNQVINAKREMILNYFPRAIERFQAPLVGCIPYKPDLSHPSLGDFASLFSSEIIGETQSRFCHFDDVQVLATSTEDFFKQDIQRQLMITHAGREDLILSLLKKLHYHRLSHPHELGCGLILTGKIPPRPALIEQLKQARLPLIYVPMSSYQVIGKINNFVAKIQGDDQQMVHMAISLVKPHLFLDKILHSTT